MARLLALASELGGPRGTVARARSRSCRRASLARGADRILCEMISVFHGDDAKTHEAFQAWRRANANGFHMTEGPAGVFTVHYAQDKRENDSGRGCWHQGGSSNRYRADKGGCYTTARKVCSKSLADLHAWAKNAGFKTKNCGHCDTRAFPFSAHLRSSPARDRSSSPRRPESGKPPDAGEQLRARQATIARMAATALATVAGANGQQVVRTLKNKDFRFGSPKELEQHIAMLFEAQGGRCAITGLRLQLDDGHDPELVCSLDRKDSNKHYEAGNLQVVCKFINRWKSDGDDAVFRRLIDVVRGAG